MLISGKGSAAVGISIRLRAAGTDASGANYTLFQAFQFESSTFSGVYQTSQTSGTLSGIGTNQSFTVVDISSPQLAEQTLIIGRHTRQQINDSFNTIHTLANSHDGFSIFPASGNITVRVQIFGYKD